MTDFLAAHHLTGLTTGVVTFLIIGVFHPVVIKAEYYWGARCWWVFLIAGMAGIALSILAGDLFVSTVMGVAAFSCFWSILELFSQTKRVAKGWFPTNPKRMNSKKTNNNIKQMKTMIQTDLAPQATGPYSQAVRKGGMLFASGQLGIDPSTGNIVPGGVKEETGQLFKNLRAILAEAGFAWTDVVKTTVFLTDMADFADMNGVYASHFEPPFPARSTVAVRALPKNGRVEMELIAIRN